VILINLLPHREAARKRRREAFFVSLAFSGLAGGVIAGAVFLWYAAQVNVQQSRNSALQNEIKRLEGQIKDIATLQEEIAALRARQQAVEDLQSDRNLPVHMLNELTRLLPDGVYVNSLRQDGQVVTLVGVAQSNERVSELLRNFTSGSPWLAKPELVEIVAGNVNLGPKDVRRVSNFTVKVRLLRSSEAQKAASAAASGAPSAGASGPAQVAANAATAATPQTGASGTKKAP
jgi:type IV pilus assembly protein PilN